MATAIAQPKIRTIGNDAAGSFDILIVLRM
jgi:hypothetical protein